MGLYGYIMMTVQLLWWWLYSYLKYLVGHWYVPSATFTCLFSNIDLSFQGHWHVLWRIFTYHMCIRRHSHDPGVTSHNIIHMSMEAHVLVPQETVTCLLSGIIMSLERHLHMGPIHVSGKRYLLVHWWAFTCLLKDFQMSLKDIQMSFEGHSSVPWETIQCPLRDIQVSLERLPSVPWETFKCPLRDI